MLERGNGTFPMRKTVRHQNWGQEWPDVSQHEEMRHCLGKFLQGSFLEAEEGSGEEQKGGIGDSEALWKCISCLVLCNKLPPLAGALLPCCSASPLASCCLIGCSHNIGHLQAPLEKDLLPAHARGCGRDWLSCRVTGWGGLSSLLGPMLFFYNSFGEISSISHSVHPLSLCDSIAFSIFAGLCNHPLSPC